MVCSSNFHKKNLHLGMGYSKCSNSVVDKLSILTYPIFDTGNVWNWATEVHRCCLAPASRVAYNVPLHVHSHQLGTPCVLTLLSLSLSCVRELLVVLYKDNSRDVNNNRGNHIHTYIPINPNRLAWGAGIKDMWIRTVRLAVGWDTPLLCRCRWWSHLGTG